MDFRTIAARELGEFAEKLAAAAAADLEADTARIQAEAQRAVDEAAGAAQRESARADALAQDLAAARADLAKTVEELANAQRAARDAQTDATAVKEAIEQRVRDLQLSLIKAEAARAEQVRAIRDRTVKLALEPIEHLRSAFHRFSSATTMDDVLDGMLEALGTEFARVALFDVAANRIEGRRHIGFDAEGGISKVVVPLNVQSPLANAVRSAQVQGFPARELTDPSHVPFGGTPTFVLALPVPVRGRVIAVLYADDCDQRDAEFVTPERQVKFAEALLWHVVPLLTRLSIEADSIAELRAYAASVVRDLESVYLVDAAGHKGPVLRERLQHNLDYARDRFADRIESEPPSAATLLDEEIAKAVKAATPFARELAAVAGVREAETLRPSVSQRG